MKSSIVIIKVFAVIVLTISIACLALLITDWGRVGPGPRIVSDMILAAIAIIASLGILLRWRYGWYLTNALLVFFTIELVEELISNALFVLPRIAMYRTDWILLEFFKLTLSASVCVAGVLLFNRSDVLDVFGSRYPKCAHRYLLVGSFGAAFWVVFYKVLFPFAR